mgnify:CR=1 FL=1
MGVMLKGRMGAVENLLSGGLCGVIYGLFAGERWDEFDQKEPL